MNTRYTLIRTVLISSLLWISLPTQSYACAIQSGPPPVVAEYIKNVRAKATEVRNFASANNKCTGTQGSFSSENRALSTLDRIDAEFPAWGNIFTDFQYSILLAAKGEARGPVTTQGTAFRNLETTTLIPTLKTAASACVLDQNMPGGTPEVIIGSLIAEVRSLEAYFKQVAMGETGIPAGISPEKKELYTAIRDYYNPTATTSCQGSVGLDTIETKMTEIMQRLQGQAKKTNDTQDDWEKAIELFSGKGKNTKKYQDLQRRLLTAELARQGVTQKARDAMLGNLSCFQKETTRNSTLEEMAEARAKCTNNVIQVASNVFSGLRFEINKAPNTDEYMRRLQAVTKAQERLGPDMASFWRKIEETKNIDEKTNDEMITNLVNIHAELTLTNNLLKVKIEEMYKNCMKARPDIKCPRP